MFKFNVRFHNFAKSEALELYAIEKISKLEKFFEYDEDREINVDIRFEVQGYSRNKVTTLITNGSKPYFVEEVSRDDMYNIIDKQEEKLERQLRKTKTRYNKKKNIPLSRLSFTKFTK